MRVAVLAMLACLGWTACRTVVPEVPPPRPQRPAPEARPVVEVRQVHLVPYPGLEVSYVMGTSRECYFHRGRYYCFYRGDWFHARRLRGPWRYIPMKYVPSDLYRVRGHRPAGIKEPVPAPTPPPADDDDAEA